MGELRRVSNIAVVLATVVSAAICINARISFAQDFGQNRTLAQQAPVHQPPAQRDQAGGGMPWQSKSDKTTLFLPLTGRYQQSFTPYVDQRPRFPLANRGVPSPGRLVAVEQGSLLQSNSESLLSQQGADEPPLAALESMGPAANTQSSPPTRSELPGGLLKSEPMSLAPGVGANDSANPAPLYNKGLIQPHAQPLRDPRLAPSAHFLSSELPGAGHGSDAALRVGLAPGEDPHAAVFSESLYPSAIKCGKCHQKVYDEWRASAHAYAAVSPMFQKFEQTITQITQGTIGTFCMRCHAPVATQMCYPRQLSLVDGDPALREGITCVACHRVKERYGRVNGERRIEPGDNFQPVYGGIGGDGVARVAADADNFKVKLHPDDKRPGQELHQAGIQFEQLSQSGFCVSCHQVVVHPGIALEVVWAQYRASPAFKKGVTCQDCHMGLIPGKASGYATGPAAEISGKTIENNRKHSNHSFYGPGMPIAHPGIFPLNEKSLRWKLEQWLEFDWRSDWGTPEFEKLVATGAVQAVFPETWTATDERRDARKVLDENLKAIETKRELATITMNSAVHIDGPFFETARCRGRDLVFHYSVQNASDGHNMPSGSLGAQPQLWLNVVLTGPDGKWLWESGYLDRNGDLADHNSAQVTGGLIPRDRELFNLQSRFLITGVKGPDREMCLPINVDFDQLPFLRPGAVPITVLNHPPFIRMEAHSLPPLGAKNASYRVPGNFLQRPGVYRLSVRLRSRMEPIYFMRFCNSTPEMERRMIEQTLDLAPYSIEFEVP